MRILHGWILPQKRWDWVLNNPVNLAWVQVVAPYNGQQCFPSGAWSITSCIQPKMQVNKSTGHLVSVSNLDEATIACCRAVYIHGLGFRVLAHYLGQAWRIIYIYVGWLLYTYIYMGYSCSVRCSEFCVGLDDCWIYIGIYPDLPKSFSYIIIGNIPKSYYIYIGILF